MSIFGSIGTLDSDLSFIYSFIDILKELLNMIADFFTKMTGGAATEDGADKGADA